MTKVKFGLHLEFLLRRMPMWRAALDQILGQEGDLAELGKKAEKAQEKAGQA